MYRVYLVQQSGGRKSLRKPGRYYSSRQAAEAAAQRSRRRFPSASYAVRKTGSHSTSHNKSSSGVSRSRSSSGGSRRRTLYVLGRPLLSGRRARL